MNVIEEIKKSVDYNLTNYRYSADELLIAFDCLTDAKAKSERGCMGCPFTQERLGIPCRVMAYEAIKTRIKRIDLVGEEMVQRFAEEAADLRKQVVDLETELEELRKE